MDKLEALRQTLPEHSKDQKMNLQNVLTQSKLSKERVWGTAVACAIATRHEELKAATLADAIAQEIPEGVLEDAKAAATVMGMNNVYYRFRHFMGEQSDYQTMRANLRMHRIAKVTSDKVTFELFCLAVSAINGCEQCVRSHEKVVTDGGMTREEVHDAVRIASVLNAVAIALEQRES